MSLTKIHRSSSTLIIIPFMVPELCSLNHCKMAHLWSSCPNDATFVVFLSQRCHICGLLVPTMAHLWSSCPNDGTFVVVLSQRWHIYGLLVPTMEHLWSSCPNASLSYLYQTRRIKGHVCLVYLFCLCFYDLPLGFWNWFYALSFIF